MGVMSREIVKIKEIEGDRFYYVDFGYEDHGRKSFRLWVSSKLVKKDEENDVEYVEFPCRARIVRTEKGTLILKPSEEYWVYNIYVGCGYRGSSEFAFIEPAELDECIPYLDYSSPRGSLGISKGALVMTKAEKVKIDWRKTGRTYGEAKHGIRIYYADGKVEDVEDVADIEELKEVID